MPPLNSCCLCGHTHFHSHPIGSVARRNAEEEVLQFKVSSAEEITNGGAARKFSVDKHGMREDRKRRKEELEKILDKIVIMMPLLNKHHL